ncbi:MAG: OmpA family protein [Prevotella sp.]|nr:OmpA family protein [Prevotella sp.]
MNRIVRILLVGVLMGMGMTMTAQTESDASYKFKKHAFLNVEGGAQYTLGEAKFSKLLSPNAQLGLGYQFSPVFGARIQANAWQSKGGWNGICTEDYKYNYVAPGIDLMLNLSNLLCGWNPDRLLNVTAFLGGGANFAWGNDEVNDIAARVNNISGYNLENLWDGSKVLPFGRGGVELGFRLSDAVSLLVEGNANVLSDKYNSKKADNVDWYFNGLVGLRINLGKTRTKVEAPVRQIVAVAEPEPVAEPQPVVEAKPQVEQQPVEKKVEECRRDVFFELNKYDIRESEQQKVADIAAFLQQNPQAKVMVTGYADAVTGNDAINDRLAAQRAAVVAKALCEQYGIAADRVLSDSKGSHEQPFKDNEKNRVSICIAK